jgi:hypothetical protein
MIELNKINGDHIESQVQNLNVNSQEHSIEGDKSKLIIINDSDYKHSRKAKIEFSTKYLTFYEEVKLMNSQKYFIYKNNLKVISFILLSPLIFLTVLQIFQMMTDKYNESNIISDHEIIEVDRISLKCTTNNLGKYPKDCISIGIAIIVYIIVLSITRGM